MKRKPSVEVVARRAGKKISRALAEVAKACVDAGLTAKPELFFEPEGASIFVQDGDHVGSVKCDRVGARVRQQANVAEIPVRVPGVPFGAGAW